MKTSLLFFGVFLLLLASPNGFPEEYHTYDEMVSELNNLNKAYSDITRLEIIGESYEGRKVYAMVVTDNPSMDENEPQVLYFAAHHAREAITVEVVMYFLNHILSNYESDPEVRRLVDERELWFVPMVNPDGHVKVEKGFFGWRKNTNPPDGVDLNRNYDYHWLNDKTSSDNPYSEIYRGEAPFSEAETQNMKRLLEENSFILALDYHSYGGYIAYPYSQEERYRKEMRIFDAIAREISEKLDYRIDNSQPTFGKARGYLFFEKGIYTFLIEVYKHPYRPSWSVFQNFNPPQEKLKEECERQISVELYVAKIADDLEKAFFPLVLKPLDQNQFELEITNRDERGREFRVSSSSSVKFSEENFKLKPQKRKNLRVEVESEGLVEIFVESEGSLNSVVFENKILNPDSESDFTKNDYQKKLILIIVILVLGILALNRIRK
ncbi:MAG: M14 family metallopeptidase [Candidatus Methanofastidiosia archaeon]